jgi:hypothetical protein
MMGEVVDRLLLRPWIALVITLVVATIIDVVGQNDLLASDPLWYANIAHTIAVKPSELIALHGNHPFAMRIGLTFPLALLYRVFGVSTFVTNLPSLAGELGVILVVYAAAVTPRAKVLGMVFCLVCTPLVANANWLNVDLPSAALMGFSILCLTRRVRPRGVWWVVGAMVAWIGAFLVKETALWCGPVWIYAIVSDLRSSGGRYVARTFGPALVVGSVLAAGYLVLCAQLWGDPWARFVGLDIEHAWSLHGGPTSAWVARLTWQPAVLLATMFQAMLIPVAFAPWLVRGAERLWWIATAAFALLYWFGSTTMSAYVPLPISPRMVLPLLPGLLVLAALASDQLIDRLDGSRWRQLIVVVFATAVVVPSARAIASIVRRARPETAAFAALREEVAADPNRRVVLVCGEPRCTAISTFYFGFELPPNLTVVLATDFAQAPLQPGATIRALVNLPRSGGARRTDPHSEMTAPIEALKLPRIAGNRNVSLYDASDGARLWSALRAAALASH